MFTRKWDRRFFELAKEVASWSKDPEKQVGAVIVSPDARSITLGYNGFPPGIKDDGRLYMPEIKNSLSLHAELNAILNASESLQGWTLYVTKAPCLQCALAIIRAKIACVVAPLPEPDSKWYLSCGQANTILHEAGILTECPELWTKEHE